MRDLAAAAGVHISTVSRVLSGNTSRISPETAETVRRLAAEMNFRAHPGAASLRSGRTKAISVLVPRISDIVLATTFESIEIAAAEHGYQAVVSSTFDNVQERRRRIEFHVARRVDGLIIADARLRTPHLADLHRRGVPFVLVSRRSASWPAITGDDLTGGRLAGEHLYDLGHRDVAVLAGPHHASTAVDRTRGFTAVFADRGAPIDPRHVVSTSFDVAGGRAGMLVVLESHTPTAVFAVNDYAAIGAIGVLHEHGLVTGRDVAVVGYNDISIASELVPPLTSVRSQVAEVGRLAVLALLALLRDGTAPSQQLTPELIIRASSCPPPTAKGTRHGT